MHIVKRPNHTTWDLSRFGSIVRLVNERSTLEFFRLGATFQRLILWDKLHNRQYLINTQSIDSSLQNFDPLGSRESSSRTFCPPPPPLSSPLFHPSPIFQSWVTSVVRGVHHGGLAPPQHNRLGTTAG